MQYRRLGSAGVKVSLLGLGGNSFSGRCDYAQSARVIDQALDIGVNMIDTADKYGVDQLSEVFIGKAVKGKRHQAFIATKFGQPISDGPNERGTSRGHLMDSLHASLKKLDTDYIDLYYLHLFDRETPIEETLRALDDAVHQGKVRYIGCSKFAGFQLMDALWTSKHLNLNPFVAAQNHYNVIERSVERELVPACLAGGVGLVPYFPLESGILTGKYRRGQPPPKGSRADKTPMYTRVLTERNYALAEKLEAFAKSRGHTLTELALSWLAMNPSVSSIIAGATSPEQVVENAKALEWHLSADEMKAVDALAPLPA